MEISLRASSPFRVAKRAAREHVTSSLACCSHVTCHHKLSRGLILINVNLIFYQWTVNCSLNLSSIHFYWLSLLFSGWFCSHHNNNLKTFNRWYCPCWEYINCEYLDRINSLCVNCCKDTCISFRGFLGNCFSLPAKVIINLTATQTTVYV